MKFELQQMIEILECSQVFLNVPDISPIIANFSAEVIELKLILNSRLKSQRISALIGSDLKFITADNRCLSSDLAL